MSSRTYEYKGNMLTAREATVVALEKGKAVYGGAEYDEAIAAVRERGADAIMVWNASTLASGKQYWTPTEVLENEAVKPETAEHPDLPTATLNCMIRYGSYKVI
jgi:hypothetical protein